MANSKKLYGLDCETHDPCLKDKGTSWVFNEGELLCTAVYNADARSKKYFDKSKAYVKDLILREDILIVGANIIYDLGWLTHFHGITEMLPMHFIDVEIAESHIDETARTSLEELGKKYLGYGKKKSELEVWAEGKGLKGDVRKHLKLAKEEVPELLKEYVMEDASIACLVWEKQKVIIEREQGMEALQDDFDMIPILLAMKQRGCPIDMEEKNKNRDILTTILDKLLKEFNESYGEVNIKSPKQLQAFFDKHNMPYRYKVRIKEYDGEKVTPENASDVRYAMNKYILKGFSVAKGEVIGLFDMRFVDKIKALLDKNNIMYLCNPTIDSKWREKISVKFPIASEMQDIAKATDILSKILGDNYNKYIAPDGRIHPNFNISKRNTETDDIKGFVSGTKTGRLSSDNPNGQNIPSKGKLFEGTKKELQIVPLCRRPFIPEEGCWAMKIDYSQIEYRLLLHFAVGEEVKAIIQKFVDDPHTDYHQFVVDISGLERKYAKNLNFGIMYGMQLKRMLETFGWEEDEGQILWDKYHTAMPFVAPTMKAIGDVALKRATGKVKDRRGNIRSYDPLTAYVKLIGGRKLHMEKAGDTYLMLNKLNQGSSAYILKKAMIQATKQGVFDKIGVPHLQVHDELFCSIPKTVEGLQSVFNLQAVMENTVKLKVPLLAEPELGYNWYDVPFSFSFDSTGTFVEYEKEKYYYKTTAEAYKIIRRLEDAKEL